MKFWLKNNKVTQFFIIYSNDLRRWIVHKLLGDNIILEESIENKGYIRLIDMKRRIPYYWWIATKINKKDTKLITVKYEKNKNRF